MKFAKTLEDVMIPEWQTKYVEYKVGKKRINATTIKLRYASSSPAINALRASRIIGDPRIGTRGRRLSQILAESPHLPSRWSNSVCSNSDHVESDTTAVPERPISARSPLQPALSGPPQQQGGKRTSYLQAGKRSSFRNSWFLPGFLNNENKNQSPQSQGWKRASYGSSGFWQGISQNPQDDNEPFQPTKPPSLVLPDPIQPVGSPDVYEGEAIALGPSSYSVKSMPIVTPQSRPNLSNPRPLLKRLFTLGKASAAPPQQRAATIEEVQAEAEKEFLKWLLGELKKCEEFYQSRENEALKRFDEMREQLDIMRDRWFKAKHNIPFEEDDTEDIIDTEMSSSGYDGYPVSSMDSGGSSKKRVGWKSFTEAVNGLTRPQPTTAQVYTGVITAPEGTRDYVRRAPARKPLNNPAHRFAKRRLKRAYIEYYHGLEMLKSYVTVNRECFRKITKKFDKASGLRTSHRFMTGYVDKSRFGGTDNELDALLNDTEALFARFFERGNRKEASARLRSKESKALYYGSVSRSWFYIGTAFVIGLYGLHNTLLRSHSPDEASRSSYLLQIWGGVALLLLQALLFTFNLRVWKNNKINYAFIFEFDPHNQLNYRQFMEVDSVIFVCLWGYLLTLCGLVSSDSELNMGNMFLV
ncbi:SPX-domain-containing protein [Wilcoxina mikolae CBS 423.85]|nr:SPX-domain-containing protein [Wilcoxina mikolae CBS 423.85]